MGLGDYFLPNHATAFGLDDVRLCDALVPARHQTLVQRLLQQNLLNGWLVYASPWTGFRFPNPALDLLAVRYVIVSSAAYPDYVRRHGVAYTDAEFRGGMILENPTAWPRIFALDVPIRESSPAAALDRVERELGRGPFAVVEADFPAAEWERLCARGCGGLSTRVEGIRFGANDLTLDAEVSGPAVLTVTDTLTEGWEASVDGVAATLFHVNYAFRGILLPAGRHAVRFWYAPAAWTIAWILAALGCLLGGGLSVAAIARGRSRRERVVH